MGGGFEHSQPKRAIELPPGEYKRKAIPPVAKLLWCLFAVYQVYVCCQLSRLIILKSSVMTPKVKHSRSPWYVHYADACNFASEFMIRRFYCLIILLF